jgi:hypothetical protein
MVATVVVLSALALWLVLGVGNAATRSDAVQVEPSAVASFVRAAKSCPTLTPARLAAQVMAKTGFEPTPDGGIAGLTAKQWKTWAPSADSSPADREASLLALAHLTCDLVGQVRASEVTGDRWRLAVAASQSSVKAVKDAAGVPPSTAAFVERVVRYADFYASEPLLGSGAKTPTPSTTATPGATASASPTASPTPKPSQTSGVSSLAKPTQTASRAEQSVQIQREGFVDASGLRLNGSAHVSDGRLYLAAGSAQAASAWATTRIDPSRSFQTSFTAQISNITDGVAFVVQGQGPTALGNAGSRLGYGQDTTDSVSAVKPSLAVELDTWDNSPDGFDPAGHQHIAVTLNGDHTNHRIWRDPGFSMWGSQPVYVRIAYDASAHRLTVWAASVQPSPTIGREEMRMATRPALFTYGVDLTAVVGTEPAYVGFTGGTGRTTVTDAQESIIEWSLVSR